MTVKIGRLGKVVGISAIVCAVAQSGLAQTIDFSDAETAGNEVLAFLRGPLATVAFGIGFVVTGFLAAFNKISWMWVLGIVLGALLVFGGPAFVDNLRTLFS